MGTERELPAHTAPGRDVNARTTAPTMVRRLPITDSTAPSGLIVGAATDPAERDADRLAGDALARLHGMVAPALGAVDASAPSRIRRAVRPGPAVIGAGGGALDAPTNQRIQRARRSGAALAPEVRDRMERGFGTDFGRVRVHTGREATELNDHLSAQAFTVGRDVFLHDRAADVGAPAGESLLAHELAHVVQGAGTVHRRLWSSKLFAKQTDEGPFTRRGTAQKALEKMLEAYHAWYPSTEVIRNLPLDGLNKATQAVAEMRDIAEAWIASHTVTLDDGTTKTDPNRKKRMAGMTDFVGSCEDELARLMKLAAVAEGKRRPRNPDTSTVQVTNPSEKYEKVIQHYTGDATSAFRKLGVLAEAAAPLDGDSAKIVLEVKIPIPPGPGFVGFEFSAQAKRDGGKLEVGLNLGVTGGATVDVATIGAALGGYVKAAAKTGADVAELLSYGLFRRCRQSNLLPREIENKLWGGSTGSYGWQKAELWSRDVETRIFGSNSDAFVETGGYVSATANAKLPQVTDVGGSVKGTLGTKIDQKSLTARKGGAGNRNLKSGADPTSTDYDKPSSRGAQKSVGVGVGGLEITVLGKAGPVEGSVKCELGWRSDGKHGDKKVELDKLKFTPSLAITLPMNKVIADGLGNVVPHIVALLNRTIRASVDAIEGQEQARMSGVALDQVGTWAGAIASLKAVPASDWQPFVRPPSAPGTKVTGTIKYTASGDFDFKKMKLAFSLSQTSSGTVLDKVMNDVGKTVDRVKFQVDKQSRVLAVNYDGSKWTVS